jgi:hypothetical protein
VATLVDKDSETLRRALKRLPAPEPRAGFVDRAFAKATEQNRRRSPGRLSRLAQFVTRWEMWVGAVLGGAVATLVTLMMLRSPLQPSEAGITLALNEMRNIDVLIDSERALEDATIRIVATGSVALDGFDNEREIDWQAQLTQGSNMLSLPVVARSKGAGQLVAVIEHGGRSRRVTVNLTVLENRPSRT